MNEWQLVGIMVVIFSSIATIAWHVGVWSYKRKAVCNGKLSQFVTITMCGERMEREQISKDEMEKHAEALREGTYQFREFQNDVVAMKSRITKIEERLDVISTDVLDVKTVLRLICFYYKSQFPDFHVPEELLKIG